MVTSDIAKLIDHSLLRPDATIDEIRKLCEEAIRHGFFSVCVNPFYVPAVKEQLSASAVKVGAVISFPLGMTSTRAKIYEAMEASLSGVDEIDIVMNIGMARSGRWNAVKKDVSDVLSATKGIVRKIIIETCYLDLQEKRKACEVVLDTGAEFIKTSTGFGPSGANADDVRLIKGIVGNRCGIKAAGGIKTLSQVKELLAVGATRIGTSAGVAIMKEIQNGYSGIPLNR